VPTRRALITGASGQDGALLAGLLLDEGYEVARVVRRDPAEYADNLADVATRIELVRADLLHHTSLVQALEATRPTEVYNLAAPSFVPQSWDEPIRTAEFAAVGATSMLEAIREVDPAIRFYQASSSEIFGEPRETPQTEETAPSPLTPYGVAKAYAHFIAASYRKRYGMFTCCGILYNHESPLRPVDFLPRKVARAAAAISLGLESELVLGDLSARRDWGYAGDYVRRRHRAKPSGGRRGGAVPGRDDRREAGACVRSEGRHERLVRVASHPRESACELPGVRLTTARDPRDERQHAEGDAHRPGPAASRASGPAARPARCPA
jgi:GDPmannose 4,6-dehydratase